MLDVSFLDPALPRAGALVLPAAEDAAPSELHRALDEASGGAVTRALQAAGFRGRKGQSATIWGPGLREGSLTKVVAIGLGKPEAIDAVAAGGMLVPHVAQEREVLVAAEALTPAQAADLALGAALRAYRFDRYRTREKDEDKPKLVRLGIAVADRAAADSAWGTRRPVAHGVHLTRDLVSEPPNVLNPAELADRCRALERLGVEVEVLGPEAMKRLGMGALLGVAQGSLNEPRLVVMQWKGAGGQGGKPVAFVGKGVTFDTGGISIKPAAGMEDMKYDMAGAGTVIGLMAALAGRQAKVDAVGLVGLVENMPSGNAQRPGDVVTTMSGQTVEVINTDAEGRLVLADVIWYGEERFQPRAIVDLATLTGAIIIALGNEHAGLFSNDDALATELQAAGRATGETLWRMPLGDAYDKQIRSEIADMKNVGGRPGGSISAAQFIQRFVGGKAGARTPWAHLDIAGTAWATKDHPTTPKGATAFGVRLLNQWVADHLEG
ncbi:leucyl aminopeptidase [Roseomonas sp. NAR14]|uniref:Probable cytosol aminopeptidase n=1 Tax=Roseomonas acroporae TaxID=2937791 RepID=A0A9X1YBE8_9PROT|nr:leucyl aminopeptidase [Roseomonas acroporae]MCK8783466.1 leucyl aminopeptidase [Roseomonas acroporae]